MKTLFYLTNWAALKIICFDYGHKKALEQSLIIVGHHFLILCMNFANQIYFWGGPHFFTTPPLFLGSYHTKLTTFKFIWTKNCKKRRILQIAILLTNFISKKSRNSRILSTLHIAITCLINDAESWQTTESFDIIRQLQLFHPPLCFYTTGVWHSLVCSTICI